MQTAQSTSAIVCEHCKTPLSAREALRALGRVSAKHWSRDGFCSRRCATAWRHARPQFRNGGDQTHAAREARRTLDRCERAASTELGFSILFLIAWIAGSDGSIHSAERERIREMLATASVDVNADTFIRSVANCDPARFVRSCRALTQLPFESRLHVVDLAIGIAVADGRLAVGENHILRLLADLLELPASVLATSFATATGMPFPAPGDPSSVDWWKAREQTRDDQRSASGHSPSGQADDSARSDRRRRRTSSQMTRSAALAILGLDSSASHDAVRTRFRELARIHHPDRFAALGDEAVAVATTTFTRIREAHDALIR